MFGEYSSGCGIALTKLHLGVMQKPCWKPDRAFVLCQDFLANLALFWYIGYAVWVT
jgi:hypothetical protein